MQFEKQDYQERCVGNIIRVLTDCDARNNDFGNLDLGKLDAAIDKLWQRENYTRFKKAKGRRRLDVLMETGTGKTFAYLKTIFEIEKTFGGKKFIIAVPRTAIKLGVIQNIRLTRDYFFNEYGKHLKYIDYPKDGLSKINHDFLRTEDLVVLITTHSAFNSEKNKINRTTETLFESGSVWQGIQAKEPIVIIDEPHLMKGAETQKGLDQLERSLQIRFGATFPNDKKDEAHHLSNVVYGLDSISAFRKYLVKGITVHTLIGGAEQGGLKISFTESRRKAFMTVYDINQVVHRKRIRLGEDIGTVTGLAEYKNVKAAKITQDKVYLDNRKVLEVGKGNYQLGEEETRRMVRATIEKHFAKEARLFQRGVKALSLFFIPNIADFRASEHNPKPRIKTVFEAEYRRQRAEILERITDRDYRQYLAGDFDDAGNLRVHQGYFSGDKVNTKDKKAGLNKDDVGVDMILNQKEKLLSFETPLRFIFSVWALQEGWDNPNVFTLCKLADTGKDTSRRQQVGRGLRIAVNQQGVRQTYAKLDEKEADFYDVNTLDVVVSGKEKEFIGSIQEEIQAASFSLVGDTITLDVLKGLELTDIESAFMITTLTTHGIIDQEGCVLSSVYEFLKSNREQIAIPDLTDERYREILRIFTDNRGLIKDGNQKTKQVKIRPNQWRKFKELWETINKKSKIAYRDIAEEAIIDEVAKRFDQENIVAETVKTVTRKYNAQEDRIETVEATKTGEVDFFRKQKFADFLESFVKREKFGFGFTVKLLNRLDTEKIKRNPKQAKERLLSILKDTIHGMILSRVSYEFSQTAIYPNGLQDEQGNSLAKIKGTLLGRDFDDSATPDHLLYDTVCFDSQIEKSIQQDDPAAVNGDTVTVFAKLPKISIPTPYKTYNPDFAYLIERQSGKKLFLVVEAKGYESESDIPQEEKRKIGYAEKFFQALQNELPDVKICYRKRTLADDLINILGEMK